MLGIIAGGGNLPRKMADHFDSSGNRIFFIAIRGVTEPETVEGRAHSWIKLGQVQKALDEMLKAGVQKVAMAGPIKRPALSSLDLDSRASKMLVRGGLKIFGDDGLLTSVVNEIEKEGMNVIGIDEILSCLLTKKGLIAGPQLDSTAVKDVERGVQVLYQLGRSDVGQSIAVQEGLVLALEAIEGTDQMIKRAGELKRDILGPILVKISKPYQERRVDLPTIGLDTVHNALAAGFRGIALEANATLLLEKNNVVELANKKDFFITGVDALSLVS